MIVQPIVVGELDTNCYLAYKEPEHAVLIDPGADAARIKQVVAEHHANVEAILLTHAHFDHILASEELSDTLQAPIYVHTADAASLEDSVANMSALFGVYDCRATADHRLQDGDEIKVGDMTLRLMHTPGHSAGSCCYEVVGEDVLFAGDTMFYRSYGRTDAPDGSFREMVRSLHRLMAMDGDRTVYSGHGPATTLSAERRFNPILQDV